MCETQEATGTEYGPKAVVFEFGGGLRVKCVEEYFSQ